MVDCVETPVETPGMGPDNGTPVLSVRMFGPLTILRGDTAIALPASRKVRALFAYLALNPNPATRSHLCELLWEVPNDPRRTALVPQQDPWPH